MSPATFETMSQAEQYAATEGIRLTPNDRDGIRKAQEAELARLRSLQNIQETDSVMRLVEGFNRLYPRFLRSLVGLGDVLLTFTQTIIISFGVPVVLVLLLVVEQQRVVHGILLFEASPELAAFAAWALVILNLVLEFQIHYIEHQEGFNSQNNYQPSLRLWFRAMAYRIGIGSNWEAIQASPAQRYKKILRLVTVSILVLALAGSMQAVIAEADGSWYSAIITILLQSDLSTMTTWLGGLLFATAAVLAAQGLSRYVALRTVEVVAEMQAEYGNNDQPFSRELEAVAVQFVLAKVAASHNRQAEKDAAEVASSADPFRGQKPFSETE